MVKPFIFILLTSYTVSAQTVIALGSGTAAKGGSSTLSVSLATGSGSQSGELEWTMNYSSTDITSVTVSAGSSLSAAGKSLSCSSTSGRTTCVTYGMNQNAIGNGTVASATLNVSASAPDPSIPVSLSSVVVSNPAGSTVSVLGTGGSISVNPTTPPLSALTCASGAVTGPASVSCTVTLGGTAPSAGVSVALSSNNSSVTVPGTITVPSGSSSASFAATAAAVNSIQNATLNASASGVSKTFTLTVNPSATWTISGSAGVAGATITLSGGSSAVATSGTSGAYSFGGLANGSYTITPSMSGVTFTPVSQTVSVNGSNVTLPNFTAQSLPSTIKSDVFVTQDHSNGTALTTPLFSTKSANELVLALISMGGRSQTRVRSVSGAGLTWVLVGRTDVQSGSAEIWRAFSPAVLNNVQVSASFGTNVPATIAVVSLTGVDTTGTHGSGAIGAIASANSSGSAPSATLKATRQNSIVIGVGDDTRSATARTAGSGQVIMHQYTLSGGTFWIQTQPTPSSSAGVSVTINDTAPTNDPYNLEICEILPAVSPLPALQPIRTPVSTSLNQADPRLSSAAQNTAAVLSDPVTGIAADACSPAGLASLIGTGFVNAGPEIGTTSPLPVRLAGASVQINGEPAPLLHVSDSRINFQCPSLAPGTPLTIAVAGGAANVQIESTMKAAVPAIFTIKGPRNGAIVIPETGEVVGASDQNSSVSSRPARAGEMLTIYASGLGQTAETIPAGTLAPADRTIALNHPIKVVIGNMEIDPSFAGLAPGTVGVFQVNVQLPADSPLGSEVPVSLRVPLPDGSSVLSNEVTIPIEQKQVQTSSVNQ